MVENRSLGKNYLKLSPQNLLDSFDFCVKWLIRTKKIRLRRIVATIAALQFNWVKMLEGLPSIGTKATGKN